MRAIDADELKERLLVLRSNITNIQCISDIFDICLTEVSNAPTIEQSECKTCIHRDPEDKKCDCGRLERQGCLFSVNDDYFCKFYEKGGTLNG